MIPICIREVMTSPAETIPPDASIEEVGRLLRDREIGSVVVSEGQTVTGMVEQADVLECALEGTDLATTTVHEVMTADPPTVTAATPLQEATGVFQSHGQKRVPVTDEGSIVGVLTMTDVASYVPQLNQRADAKSEVETAIHPGVHETAYDRVDWEFTDDGEIPDAIEQGETFQFEKTITDADVSAFAEATGDTNRLHLDDAFATDTRFGNRIVHGMLLAGVISATLARLPGTVIYLSQNLQFQRPVTIGETVSAAVTAAEAHGDDRWRFETTIFDSGRDPAIDGEATVLVQE